MNAKSQRQMAIESSGSKALEMFDRGEKRFLITFDDTSRSFICVLAWQKRAEDLKRVVRSNWVHPDLARYAESALDHIEPGWRMKNERIDQNSFLSLPPMPPERMG